MAHIGETELDMRALFRAVWRRIWLLFLLAVLAAAATYVALGYVDPVYTADTRILIEERESPLTRRDPGSSSDGFDESAIQSQVELLRSREIADAVIDRLDLEHRADFDPARKPSLVRSLKVMLGVSDHPAEAAIRQRAMEAYYDQLSVYPLQRSRVIGVEFSATDPELAAAVANAVAEAFVDIQQDAKRQSAVAATIWLEQEIERLRERVAEAEQAVADYRANNELFDVDQSGSDIGNLSTQQLGDLNAELARARAARAEAEARAGLIQSLLAEGAALDESAEVLSSPLVQRLRERQVALRAQIAELSTTLLPGHPRLRALNGQVANLEEQIRQEVEKVLASLRTAARVAAAREASLQASLNEAKVDVSRSNEQEIELRALEREAAAQRGLLESFLARYREAAARTEANYLPADARIISRAVAPRSPSFPKRTMMAVAAAAAVMFVGSTIILMSAFMSGRAFRTVGYVMSDGPARIHGQVSVVQAPDMPRRAVSALSDAQALEQATPGAGPPALAADTASATNAAAEAGAVHGAEATAAAAAGAEDGREGTEEIAEVLASQAVRLALFAGAEGGEGAGSIAFAAASLAAQENLRCVLIDVGSTPSAALGYERPGLADLLAGDAAFGEVIRRDDASRLHVIPYGRRDMDLPRQRIQLVIGALTHTYDRVIVVADRLDDWPHEHIRPDVAAIVCGPETTERQRKEIYEAALDRGAQSAIIIRRTGGLDGSGGHPESAAA